MRPYGPQVRLFARSPSYIQLFDKTLPLPPEHEAAFLAAHRAWDLADDGEPFHMLNLMRYYDKLHPPPGVEIKAH